MPSGYRSGGVDFDDLFDPYVQGTKPAATGRRVSGVDLIHRYAPIAYGAKRADVGHRANGVDVSNLWAAKGTASYALSINGAQFLQAQQANTYQEQVGVTLAFDMTTAGGFTVKGNNYGQQATQQASGTWNTTGEAASNLEVLFETAVVSGMPGQVTNGAATWQPMTAVRGLTHTIGPYTGGNADTHESVRSIRVRVRRISTGQVLSDTTFYFELTTTGYA